jgi:ribosomal protein L11 methylase PrmA
MNLGRIAGSFRDPSGFIFHRDGVLLRHVDLGYRESYDMLLASGLYADLVAERLLIPHQEVSIDYALSPGAYRVLQPDRVGFISYPYCWSFSQLKDAALATLAIQRRAMARGMTLRDASAYNMQFHEGRAVLIDTLSFEPYTEGEPWVAYRQFCQHFLAPLLLVSRVDPRLAGLMSVHLDGIPLDLASAMLPKRGWLRFSTLLHVHLHARSIRRHASTSKGELQRLQRPVSRAGLLGLVDNLESAIRSLDWNPTGTEWADYESEHGYGDDGLEEKRRMVRELIATSAPVTVWDLGANTGIFSRIASESCAQVVAFDVDRAAVERNYLRARAAGERNLLPLVMDLTNPSPALGWAHEERLSLVARGPADLVLALALIHHLAISNNVPLDDVASFFASIGKELIIEFVPKSDPQVQRLLVSRKDIFDEYHAEGFESSFRRHFDIVTAQPVVGTERVLYHMKRCGR